MARLLDISQNAQDDAAAGFAAANALAVDIANQWAYAANSTGGVINNVIANATTVRLEIMGNGEIKRSRVNEGNTRTWDVVSSAAGTELRSPSPGIYLFGVIMSVETTGTVALWQLRLKMGGALISGAAAALKFSASSEPDTASLWCIGDIDSISPDANRVMEITASHDQPGNQTMTVRASQMIALRLDD